MKKLLFLIPLFIIKHVFAFENFGDYKKLNFVKYLDYSGLRIIDDPPNCLIAKSKDILVLVDGFSNIMIIDLQAKGLSLSAEALPWDDLFAFLILASSIIFLNIEVE